MEHFMVVANLKEGAEQKDIAPLLPEEKKQFSALVTSKVIDPYYTIEGLKRFWLVVHAENITEAKFHMYSLPLVRAGFLNIEIFKLLDNTSIN